MKKISSKEERELYMKFMAQFGDDIIQNMIAEGYEESVAQKFVKVMMKSYLNEARKLAIENQLNSEEGQN